MLINRRQALIGSLTAFLAAPAIVRAGSLMPVSARLIVKPTRLWADVHPSWSRTPIQMIAGEQLWIGDIVRVGADGLAYRAPWTALSGVQNAGVVGRLYQLASC